MENQPINPADLQSTATATAPDPQTFPQPEHKMSDISDLEFLQQAAAKHRQVAEESADRSIREAMDQQERTRASQKKAKELFEDAAKELLQSKPTAPVISPAEESNLIDMLTTWGVPSRYHDIDLRRLPTWLPKGYRGMAQRLLGLIESPRTMALCGDRGRGKTALGCGLVRVFIECGLYARYMTADAFFDSLRAATDLSAQMSKLTRLHLLVIDEVQDRTAPPWMEPKLTAIVDARYANRRATVLMGCLTPEEFQVNVGASIHRRVIEEAGYFDSNWSRIEELRPLRNGEAA